MVKKIIPIILLIAALFSLHFFGTPFFRQREALRSIQSVLTYWTEDDLPMAMSFWDDENNSPPVYDLLTYEIGKKSFGKKGDLHTALITVTLYFPINNPLPSGKEWVFELNKTRYGWKIMDFRLSSDQAT